MNKPNIIYLATPYTTKDKNLLLERVAKVNQCAAKLMNQGLTIFSPISMSHEIALNSELPSTWEYWEKFDTDFLSICSKLYVFCLPGWKESVGVQAEIKIAQKLGLPIEYLEESFVN